MEGGRGGERGRREERGWAEEVTLGRKEEARQRTVDKGMEGGLDKGRRKEEGVSPSNDLTIAMVPMS